MITKETMKRVQFLYQHVEETYNEQIQAYVAKQLTTPLGHIKKDIGSVSADCQNQPTKILHDYISHIDEKCIEIQQRVESLQAPFTLFIMGSGKNGKSTLINALLNQYQAEEGRIPKTWKIDIFQQNRQNDCTLTFKDGTKKIMSCDKARDFLAVEEQKRNDSGKAIQRQLKEFKKTHPSLEALEEKRQELKKYHLYKPSVIEATWPVQDSPILQKYRLVDTPGLRQEIDDMVISSAEEYFSKADGIVWILPGDKIDSKSDYRELCHLHQTYKDHSHNIVAVVNRIDLIRSEGEAKVAQVLEEAHKIYGGIIPDIIPISAKEARKAEAIFKQPDVSEEERVRGQELLAQSNVNTLIDLVNRTFLANSLQLRLQSRIQNCQAMYREISLNATEAVQLLQEKNQQRLTKKNNWEKDSADLLQRLKKELQNFRSRETSRVEQETSKVEDALWDMDSQYRNNYILTKIIRPEYIEQALTTIVQQHSRELSEIAARHMKAAPFREFPALKDQRFKASSVSGKAVGNAGISEDLSDQATAQVCLGGALAIGAAALLGPVGLLFAGFAVTDMGRSVAKWLSRTFGDSLSTKVERRVSHQLKGAMEKLYQEYEVYLKKADSSISSLREDTYRELYGPSDKSDTIIETLSRLSTGSLLRIQPLRLKDILYSERRQHHGC